MKFKEVSRRTMDLVLTNHIYFVMLKSSALSTLKENLHNLFFDIICQRIIYSWHESKILMILQIVSNLLVKNVSIEFTICTLAFSSMTIFLHRFTLDLCIQYFKYLPWSWSLKMSSCLIFQFFIVITVLNSEIDECD